MCQRNRLVCDPLLRSLCIVEEDYEVVFLALVVALDLVCFSASHVYDLRFDLVVGVVCSLVEVVEVNEVGDR